MAAADRPPATSAAPTARRECNGADGKEGREEVPEWRELLDPAAACRLDVRPILAAGEEPFTTLMRAADDVAPGGGLIVEAPFDPQPLRRVLAGKGFATYGERLGAGHWQIWCRREERERNAPGPTTPGQASARVWRTGEVVHIDVRGLEAPRPLVAILALIDGGDHHGHIVVHHNREPLYLYPELEERGWQHARLPSPEGEVCLELRGPR